MHEVHFCIPTLERANLLLHLLPLASDAALCSASQSCMPGPSGHAAHDPVLSLPHPSPASTLTVPAEQLQAQDGASVQQGCLRLAGPAG